MVKLILICLLRRPPEANRSKETAHIHQQFLSTVEYNAPEINACSTISSSLQNYYVSWWKIMSSIIKKMLEQGIEGQNLRLFLKALYFTVDKNSVNEYVRFPYTHLLLVLL